MKWLIAIIFLSACAVPSQTIPTATKAEPTQAVVSISQVLLQPQAYQSQTVLIEGYGLIVATIPLCKGYIGLDRRTQFVGENDSHIPAIVSWRPQSNEKLYDNQKLHLFEAKVHIFQGEIGCPGSVQNTTFPYLEIIRRVQ
ncbi:MAG: hypothetical protein ACPL4H_03130 [Anaerolineales bacterium]